MPIDDEEEPQDLYELRQAAHVLLDALVEYRVTIDTWLRIGEQHSLHELTGLSAARARKWARDTGFDKVIAEVMVEITPKRREKKNAQSTKTDPRAILVAAAMKLTKEAQVVIDTHEVFDNLFEPLAEEIAATCGDMCIIWDVQGRSHCKALTEVARKFIRITFSGIETYTPESEWDPEAVCHGFTASNWLLTTCDIAGEFPSFIDVEQIHELLEREFEIVWRRRDSRTASTSTGEKSYEADGLAASSPVPLQPDDSKHPVSDRGNQTVRWRGLSCSFAHNKSQLLFPLFARIASAAGTFVSFDELRGKDRVWENEDTTDETIHCTLTRLKKFLRDHEFADWADRVKSRSIDRRPHVHFDINRTP